tara:strand:- start:34399 stop:35130 length:732 start_codon:yes stop_codon:yes gene_type:complete
MNKLATALYLSTVLAAVTPVANAYWEYNYLLGASAGYADLGGNINYSTTEALRSSQMLSHSGNGFIWGVLGGVQATCNNWLFGAELSLDWHDFEESSQYAVMTANMANVDVPGVVNARYDRGTIVGFSLRAGYEMAPFFLPYFRVGGETSNDKFSTYGSFVTAGSPFFNLEDSKNVYRFLLGIGVELPLRTIPGLAFRGEYNYHSKGKVIKSEGPTSIGATNVITSMKPDTHAAKFSVVWNFV